MLDIVSFADSVDQPKIEARVALSMGGQKAFPNKQGKLIVAKFKKPKITSRSPRLIFIQDVGPGRLM